MIFSDDRISSFVREHFVAAWESVRPVPVAEIDFGGGRKIRRTLNGNIATYICAPDGRVLDVIPGLNSPESYLEDLRYALNLYQASLAGFDKIVLEYHRANLAAPTVYEWVRQDYSKSMIEQLMRMSLDLRRELVERKGIGLHLAPGPYAPPATPPAPEGTRRPVQALSAEESAILAADTEINRRERRPIVHRILSEKIVRPENIYRRIYKEALHCDLDDPYLGLVTGAFQGAADANR